MVVYICVPECNCKHFFRCDALSRIGFLMKCVTWYVKATRQMIKWTFEVSCNNFPIISNQLPKEMIIRGFRSFQNESSLNATALTNRLIPKSWFFRRVGNEEKGTEDNRSCLLYSSKNNEGYCFCCCLLHQIPLHNHLC